MPSDRRRNARRAARVVLGGLAVAHVLDTLVLRQRREQLKALPSPAAGDRSATDAGALTAGPGVGADGSDPLSVLQVAGARVGEDVLAAVRAEMEASGARVVDLVPGDLPVDRALILLRRIDPAGWEDDPLAAPAGAHEAVVVHPETAQRMGLAAGPMALERGELVRRTVDAQRHASGRSVLRLAPGLRATDASPAERWRELEELTAFARPYTSVTPVLTGLELTWLTLLTGGVFLAPVVGALALATWSAQPLLVFGGPPQGSPGTTEVGPEEAEASAGTGTGVAFTPPELVKESLLRLPKAWANGLRLAAAGIKESRAAAARRSKRPTEAPPPEGLFEDRHDTCPWCGSASIADRVEVPDLFQQKPGTFHLDECEDCGHVFQNPPLTVAGLDYYYAQFYDGVGAETAERSFAKLVPNYQGRVRAVSQFTTPRAWLDVGTGYGHFCAVARQELPDTVFDGLDFGSSVDVALRRGWIDSAYPGLFPELAGSLSRPYDVVSMYHYLEHTRDPRVELAAAAKVLEPGGYLTIEVPDPESPWARRFGRYWFQWAQPQHQHFVLCGNLVKELEGMGFEVVKVERGAAKLGGDFTTTVGMVAQSLSRSPHVPWLPPATMGERVRRAAVLTVAMPLAAAGRAIDLVKDARLPPEEIGNAYRVVARRV